jgi:prepilin-type N-terminal cleavage/methylation domain-containing protein
MTAHSPDHTTWPSAMHEVPAASLDDAGYTLVELILVVAILGILTAAVVLALTGISTEAAGTGCQADQRMLDVAVGAFHAQTGQDVIPASGTDHDRFERALVDREFLRDVSSMHDLDANGVVTPEATSSC